MIMYFHDGAEEKENAKKYGDSFVDNAGSHLDSIW